MIAKEGITLPRDGYTRHDTRNSRTRAATCRTLDTSPCWRVRYLRADILRCSVGPFAFMQLNIQHLTKVYPPNTLALEDVSLEVAERELVVILGQNGAGKTTLLNCVLGLVKPDRGKILADGQDILAKPGLARRQIAVVFEEASNIYGYMTVEENLLHSGLLNAVPAFYLREKIDRLLGEFGLYEKRHVLAHMLSRGMKQKLALAAAFLKGAPMLFLDEPTLGLDVDAKAQVIDVLLHNKTACSILLTTHDMHLAHVLGDRFYLIHRGRLVWSGTKDALRASGIADGRDLEEMMRAIARTSC